MGRSLIEMFDIVKDATRPFLQATVTDGSGTAVDLTGATAVFDMRDEAGTLKVTAASVDIFDATNGKLRYKWAAADTDTVGKFEAEFTVTFDDASILKFPTGPEPITVSVREDVA